MPVSAHESGRISGCGLRCMMVSKCASLLELESVVKRDRWLCGSVMSNQQTGCMIGG
jgi:hypothetical protein